MEVHSESGHKARDQNQAMASHSEPNTRLRDILMSDKPALSYADFHHEITTDVYRIKSRSPVRQQSQGTEGKAKGDEIGRCISKLPSYLVSGKDFQEKPLTVGDLDWRHLQNKNSDHSSSTSNATYISADGSSFHSSRRHSSSPGPKKLYHSLSQSHMEASPSKIYSQATYYSGRGQSCSPARQRTCHLIPHSRQSKPNLLEGHSRDVDSVPGEAASAPNHMVRQQNLSGLHHIGKTNRMGVRLDIDERKVSNSGYSGMTSEMRKTQTVSSLGLASSWKGKLRIIESELKKEMKKSQEPNLVHSDPDCFNEQKTLIRLPIDPTRSSRVSNASNSTAFSDKTSGVQGRRSFFQRENAKDYHCADMWSSVTYSCPLPSKEDSNKHSEVRVSSSMTSQDVTISSQQLKCPSKSGNTVDKKLIMGLKSSSSIKFPGVSDNRSCSESSTKARNPSPIRRLSSAMGSILKSTGSRENSPLRRSNSKDTIGKHEMERAGVLTSSDESCTDKSQANSRARSSPLRRLLDPLIKSKAPNVHKAAQLFKRDPSATSFHSKSSDEQAHLSKEHPIIVKSTCDNGGKKKGKDSRENLKQGSSLVQALLQVAVKNGLPLFTFAVDNDTDILAATLSKLSPDKISSGWIYTFFNVHEIKRKSGYWLNHGTKGDNQSYVPNVIAQMKVNDSQFPVDTRKKGSNDDVREFNLFSVDMGQVEGHATEFQPTHELASIVVKVSARNPSDKPGAPSHANYRGCTLLSTTLILPGGVHTIPIKGPISTLTQRWRLGGSCDCGGWDVGCQLRTFTSQGESNKSSSSSKTINASDEFKLFSRGQESQLVLSLNPFKDRMYSVEFDSSVSLLQAFATCVSVLDCRGPSGFFNSGNVVDRRTSTVVISEDSLRIKVFNPNQGEVPAGDVSYPPPHSPVGRV